MVVVLLITDKKHKELKIEYLCKNSSMGLVYADVELINGFELEMAKKFFIGQDEVKRMYLNNMFVDTGSLMLAINENIQEMMQFPVVERKRFQLANSEVGEFDIVGSVEIRFKNRRTSCEAIVLPGDSEPLLGTIPMEAMDVVVLVTRQELVVNPEHPDMAVLKLK